MSLPVALRIGLRELRGGLSGFRVFLVCLALGVMAIAAVGSVRSAIQQGLTDQAATILGGDAEIRLTYRFASDEEMAWMSRAARNVSEVVDFRSMAVIERDGKRRRALIQAKGVDPAYPIYGSVQTDPPMPLDAALETRDGVPGMIAEPALVARLGLKPGDRVRLGTQAFEFRATLTAEPDRISAGFGLGPRVIVRLAALSQSGLLKPGTLFNSQYRLQLPENTDLTAIQAQAKARFAESGLRWRDRRNGAPGTKRFVTRMAAFLVLVGLAGLAVGGIGVSAAVRAYLERKTETIATLKTIGATGGTIFAVYFFQIAALSVLGVLIGLVLGAGLPLVLAPLFAGSLPVPAEFGFYARPLAEAAIYGMMTALVFTLWPLARARGIRAAGLFRDLTAPERRLPPAIYIAATGLAAAALVGLAAWFSSVPRLAFWAAGGIAGAMLVLSLAGLLVRWGAARLSHTTFFRGRPAMRLALASVGGPGGDVTSAILSMGLGLSVLAAIGQIDSNLRNVISQELPERAPSFFFVDIQKDQLQGFLDRTRGEKGVERVDTAPMLRGIITRINGRPAVETAGDHWALRGDRGLTYAATPPPGTEVTAGTWWAADYSGPPVMSFAEEEAGEMGLKMGDRITVNVLGRELTATITSFRTVDFSNLGINFLMIMDPAALEAAPHTHIATVYAAPESEGRILADLSDVFPNITAISVRDAIERVGEMLASLGSAIRWGASATLLTGFVVLIGAAAASEQRRVFEAAVLKTLGAVRGRILVSFALRSAVVGAAAGAVAILAGGLAGWAVMTYVMEAEFHFEPISAAAIILGGIAVSLCAGFLFALKPLAVRPALVLRARE